MSLGTNTQSKTTDSMNDDLEDLTALTPNHFLLGRQNASAPIMPSIECYHDLRKSLKTAQEYADMIWKDGLVNTFHNQTRDRSGQKNMCNSSEKMKPFG